MMGTITIPARVVPYIRAGAQLQIAGAVEELASQIGEAMHAGLAPLGERRRLLRAWALVDVLGWPDELAGPVKLNVHEHHDALRGALQGNVERLAELVAEEPMGPRRTSLEGDLRALRRFEAGALRVIERESQTRITARMPGEVVELLRGALYADLERACEDMPSTEPSTRASWAPVVRRIAQARRGLDAIGWASLSGQPPVTLDVDAALIDALERDAEQWDWLSEQTRTESAEGRARAAERAAMIERFLASVAERPAPTTLLVAVAALPLLREGVYDAVEDVSNAIDTTGNLRECSRSLGALCDLLDLIGWSVEGQPSSDVEATECASSVARAAAGMLPVLARGVSDREDADPQKAADAAGLRLMRELHTQASMAAGELE